MTASVSLYEQEHGQAVDPNLVQLAAAHEQALAHASRPPADGLKDSDGVAEQGASDKNAAGDVPNDLDGANGRNGLIDRQVEAVASANAESPAFNQRAASRAKQSRGAGTKLRVKRHKVELATEHQQDQRFGC